jgi:hypothetical protein
MVTTDAECQQAAAQASELLQDVQTYLGDRYLAAAKMRFPRGFIKRVATFDAKLWFVANQTLRRNISYALIHREVYRWLLRRTSLFGIAEEMIVKQVICLTGNCMESTIRGYYGAAAGQQTRVKRLVGRLEREGVIDEDLRDDLDWVWDTRGKTHLFLVKDYEIGVYHLTDATLAASAYEKLILALDKQATKDLPF